MEQRWVYEHGFLQTAMDSSLVLSASADGISVTKKRLV
jgi:hypothetical protein